MKRKRVCVRENNMLKRKFGLLQGQREPRWSLNSHGIINHYL